MPRGVPKAGKRRPRRTKAAMKLEQFYTDNVNETDEQIDLRIRERFEVLQYLTNEATQGNVRAIIVSGPAGLGKSYTIDNTLQEWDPNGINYTVAKGYVKATGLYKLLHQHKEKGQVIVFDDADTVFFDETSLNLLKGACDTTEVRKISYLAEGNLIDEESAERLPKSFVFEGTVIFITNYDFDLMIDKGHKLAPHLQALVSRAHYVDLSLKTKRDFLIRIKQVMTMGLLEKRGLNKQEQKDIMEFVDANVDSLRELSLRIVIKIADIRKGSNSKWQNIAKITCCRNR